FTTLVRILGYPFRRPITFLAGLVIAILLGAGIGVLSLQAWGYYHLRKARTAVARYHNDEAEHHLRSCLWASPNNAEALLLAARIARREGSIELADQFLVHYERLRGPDDEQLLLERILLLVQEGHLDSVQSYCSRMIDDRHPFSPLILDAIVSYFVRAF